MGLGHKRGGTKVAGSKLKPAPAILPQELTKPPKSKKLVNGNSNKGKDKQVPAPSLTEPDEEDEWDDRKFCESIRKDKPPLTGFVVCFSGIIESVKSQATAYAEKLGARVEKALTLEVTHLICDRPGSQKYHVALQHSIRVMSPLWLGTLYSSFTEGEDIDLDDITQRYTLKSFHNLKMSLTGKTSSSRTPLIQLAEDNGASVSLDLDIDCSHLIVLSLAPAKELDETVFELEKVQAARKAPNSIKVVWQEWLEDSVERGGCLPEAPYVVKEGVPRPGRLFSLDPDSAVNMAQERKRLAACQGDELETAKIRKITKPGSQNAILASLIRQEDLPLVRANPDHPYKPTGSQRVPFDPEEELPDLDILTKTIEEIDQPNRAASTSAQAAPFDSRHLMGRPKKPEPASVLKKLSSIRSEKFNALAASHGPSQPCLEFSNPDLFRGLKISLAGFAADRHRLIVSAVTQCGAKVTDVHSQADYTIMPHINPPFVPSNCNPVAHHWVEHSFYTSKVIDPDDHWGARPIRMDPLSEASQYSFSICGFNPIEDHIIRRALKTLDLKFVECPRRSQVSHVFLGPDDTSVRVQKVKTWQEKKQVDFEWLVEMCNGQRILGSTRRVSSSNALTTPLRPLNHPPSSNSTAQNPTPLLGCVIYMTRKGYHDPHSKSLSACRKLGARVVDKLIECVTHVVHASDRACDPLRELKSARVKNLPIVHPCWLTECKNTLLRADELTFPATYKPGRALSYSTSFEPENMSLDMEASSIYEQESMAAEKTADNPVADLEEDTTFYLPSAAREGSPTTNAEMETGAAQTSSPNFAGNELSADKMLDSEPSNVPESRDTPHQPPSSHYAASPQSHMFMSSSPSHRAGPGMDTQLGGFMEILQQRNALNDAPAKAKDKDGRRGRKRSLGDTSRCTSVGTSSKRQGLDDNNRSITIASGLHRTLSHASHLSTGPSQADFPETFEESMNVTWEDPAAKREILKAINDPIGRAARRIANRHKQARGETDGWTSGMESPRSNHLASEAGGNEMDDDDPDIVIVPPLKKRKPILMES